MTPIDNSDNINLLRIKGDINMIKLSKLAKSANGKESKRYMETTGLSLDNIKKCANLSDLLSVDPNYEGLKVHQSKGKVQVSVYNHRMLGSAVTRFDKLENLELLLSNIEDYYLKNISESRVNLSNKLFISNVYGY
mgnify:CR=1 FL=1